MIFLVLTASLVSGHSQKSPARSSINNSCIIYDLFLFSFFSPAGAHHQVVQAPGTCTHSSTPAPGSSLPGQSLPALPSHPLLPAELALRFSGRKCNPHRRACLAHGLFWQVETPSSLVTKQWVIKSWRKIKRFFYEAQTVDALKTGRCWCKHLAVRLETYQWMIKMTCSLAWCLSGCTTNYCSLMIGSYLWQYSEMLECYLG